MSLPWRRTLVQAASDKLPGVFLFQTNLSSVPNWETKYSVTSQHFIRRYVWENISLQGICQWVNTYFAQAIFFVSARTLFLSCPFRFSGRWQADYAGILFFGIIMSLEILLHLDLITIKILCSDSECIVTHAQLMHLRHFVTCLGMQQIISFWPSGSAHYHNIPRECCSFDFVYIAHRSRMLLVVTYYCTN